MKRLKKGIVVSALLCVCLFSRTGVQATSTSGSALTSDSIREKEGQISEAQNQKKELQSGLTDIKKLKSQLEGQKKDLENYVQVLDTNLMQIQEKIENLKTMIQEKEEDIAETEKELEQAIETQNNQYEAMKQRIRFIYETGDTGYIEMLATASSFGDMLNKLDYIQMLSAYDSNKLNEYALTTQYVELCKEELDAEKEVLEEAKVNVEEEEASLQVLISDKESEITGFQSDINTQQAAIAEYEAEIKAQNEVIAALEAAVAEERRRLAAANQASRTYDGGMFAFPAPSYTRISSEYGNRMHPILGVEKFHNGVDLAAPNGSPILAAYDGEVVAASYSSTMGNYIMLDHGDSLYTIYMHASALYVSKGAIVTKGQKIAAVGSTGRSTGPHLHFGVRLNGAYTSPWNYLK